MQPSEPVQLAVASSAALSSQGLTLGRSRSICRVETASRGRGSDRGVTEAQAQRQPSRARLRQRTSRIPPRRDRVDRVRKADSSAPAARLAHTCATTVRDRSACVTPAERSSPKSGRFVPPESLSSGRTRSGVELLEPGHGPGGGSPDARQTAIRAVRPWRALRCEARDRRCETEDLVGASTQSSQVIGGAIGGT
jgi:hypothetical protein